MYVQVPFAQPEPATTLAGTVLQNDHQWGNSVPTSWVALTLREA